MNRFELEPKTSHPLIPHFDIRIDGISLGDYFASRLGEALPWPVADRISALGPLGPEFEQIKRENFERFLLMREPDLPDGRNSILVCSHCGDLGCGAYSARFIRNGGFIRWTEFGYENDISPDLGETEMYPQVPNLVFSWEQYQAELLNHVGMRPLFK
ncbi:MAG TPA: hypothetical protein VGQ55_12895 [Pyrinomonadaceae bacterium]|nr:hypothetical protein [Pyrinomonadaceae bacterium]